MYGQKVKYAETIDDSPPLHAAVITRFHSIFGALLFYARAVNDKILVALIELSQHQAATTEAIHDTVTQLLDYVSTYPSNDITFHARNMTLAAHSDASYINFSKAHSRAGAPITLSENFSIPSYNGPILAIAKIIKCVISSADESELCALYICDSTMVPLRNAIN